VAYKITDECAMCGMCVWECPNGAITEAELTMEIDPDKCTECVGSNPSPRCVKECPNESVVLDPAHSETQEQLIAKWESLHPGEEPKFF
jgi:Fe-S-cluster-containing hydrogenase component 2